MPEGDGDWMAEIGRVWKAKETELDDAAAEIARLNARLAHLKQTMSKYVYARCMVAFDGKDDPVADAMLGVVDAAQAVRNKCVPDEGGKPNASSVHRERSNWMEVVQTLCDAFDAYQGIRTELKEQ